MKQKKAYTYRFSPRDEQKRILAQTFGCCRYVYNWALRQRTDAYYQHGERLYYEGTAQRLVLLKKQEETLWLNEVSSVPLQQALRHLDKAFRNFFEGRADYPTFKKKRNQQSATYASNAFTWDGHTLTLAKIDTPLSTIWHRPLPDGCKPGSVTITKGESQTWQASAKQESLSVMRESSPCFSRGRCHTILDQTYVHFVLTKHRCFRYSREERKGKPASWIGLLQNHYAGTGKRREKGEKTPMGMLCLDTEDCNFENREKARLCAQCGLPLQGALVQGRYEILRLTGRDRSTVTLEALDRHKGVSVTLRVLRPRQTTLAERDTFLQDAELAMSLSSRMHEPGSIHVTDFGQDGPVAFLVKSEFQRENALADPRPFTPRVTARMEGSVFPSTPPTAAAIPVAMAPHSSLDQIQTLAGLGDASIPTYPSTPPTPSVHERPIEAASSTREPGGVDHPHESGRNQLGTYNWLAIGNHFYELARYDEALIAYDTATTEDELSVEAWSGKGATLLHLERAEEALLAYDHALSLYPNDPDLWNSRANVLHELRRIDEEMYCYEQALAYDPNYAFAWSGKGMTLAEQGRTEEALLAFDRALVLDPKQSVIWQAMSDTLYSIQRYGDALIAIDRALELDSSNAALWDTKGNILRHLKRPDEAFSMHERATQLNSQNAAVWFDQANDLRDMRRFAEALAVYDKALTLDPTLAGAWYNRGNVLAALRLYEEALELYDHALDYDEGLISAWYNKGSLLHELGRHEEALVAFDRALAIDIHYIAAWNNKGLALFALNRLNEALAALDQATSFAPEESDAWYNKAVVLDKLGRGQEARSCHEWAQTLETQAGRVGT